MNEYEENAETMQFEAIKDGPQAAKPQQNRRQNDEFSVARNGRGYEIRQKKEKGNGALIALVCILTILLVAAIVLTIVVLKGDSEKKNPQTQSENPLVQDDGNEEEEIPEIQNKIISCDLVFYPETIKEEDGVYKIKADFFNQEADVFDNKEIVINEETDIRQDGDRLAVEGFIYIIENAGGDKPIFSGEIREEDSVALALSFTSAPEEELPEIEEIPEEIPEEEEPAPEEETSDLGI